MLSRGDDYPLHQTPEPIAYVGGNRNFYDRYFFNGYNAEGSLFFAFALGVYPYVDVMDAAFSVVINGEQYNVIASKTMSLERLGFISISAIVHPYSVYGGGGSGGHPASDSGNFAATVTSCRPYS